MLVEQLYTQCLAHGAYYIESEGEAAIIDPLRETEPYLQMLEARGAKLKYIFETHFHADFVSGHIDLSERTGAPIIYGPTEMQTGFEVHIGRDGEVFPLGNVILRLIHTPGHTMESSCYLLVNEEGKEQALFTGDTLFIGDVGRPDLAQHVVSELTEKKLAAHLYDSLRNKILPLADDIIVYPGHGAGSACGKNLSKETSDTLGHQKQTNYALRDGLDKETFIQELLTGLTQPPGYFPKNVLMNINGYERIGHILERGTRPLKAAQVDRLLQEDFVLILDTRPAIQFAQSHIPGAWNIGLSGSFASWVGTVVPDIHQPIILIVEEGKEKEAVQRLARVGYDYAIGYLHGGMEAWLAAGYEEAHSRSISVETFAREHTAHSERAIIDVRKKSEFEAEHIIGAKNVPLDYIHTLKNEVPMDQPVYVHCAGGYRSMIFVSILEAQGYTNLIDVDGGFAAIKKSGAFPISEYVCPTTML